MTLRNDIALFDDLDDLLESERNALLTGDLEKVGRLVDRKEGLLEALSQLEAYEAAALEKLSKKMKRNQELLDSALEGIRAIATRLATLRRVRQQLDTYDATGTKNAIEAPRDNTLEKRA